MSQTRSHVLVAVTTAVVMLLAPAAAREVADFARNAGKVDGYSAVDAGSKKRSKKLVATNRAGRLPNDIIAKAPNAELLDGHGGTAFVLGCHEGALRGHAHVTPDLGPTFEPVDGFSTSHGGPLNEDFSDCQISDAAARRVSVGVYDVRLALIVYNCSQPLPPGAVSATVSVESASPLIATYEPFCEDNQVYVRVHVTGVDGTRADAPFTVALLEETGFPIP